MGTELTIIFDVDGTLADCEHRKHWITSRPKNWRVFFQQQTRDTIIEPVAKVFKALKDSSEYYKIVIVTGRPEEYLEDTSKWLAENELFFDEIYMRPMGDTRPDYIVKEEILDKILESGANIFCVFEDRPSVVDMWRRRGLFVLDVNQHKEN